MCRVRTLTRVYYIDIAPAQSAAAVDRAALDLILLASLLALPAVVVAVVLLTAAERWASRSDASPSWRPLGLPPAAQVGCAHCLAVGLGWGMCC